MKNEQLKEADYRVMAELRKNCRRSYREIALATGMSPVAVMNHVKRLESSGVIDGYVASFDLQKLGYEFMGFVHISLDSGHIMEAQKKISNLKGVYAVYDLTGEYDSVALVIARTRSEFSALIKKILSIPHVRKTNTNVILNTVKDPFHYREI
jgi:DNA-binding Lrp family transcriptional regulator